MDTFAKLIIDYGCDVNPQKVKGVSIGGNIFGINDDIPATIGLGPCVGLVAFSDSFTFLAHIDMGNCVGFNFDVNGKCLHLEKLYKRILQTKRDNLSFDTLYLATVSSETFRYERKWWSERAVLLDEEINRMIEICKYLGINVIRVPHFESNFCAINSKNGDFYARKYGYAIKTNIKDLSQSQFLTSFSSTEETLVADIHQWHK